MDTATVSPFGRNNNLFHLAGRRGRGPRRRETLLNLSVSECGLQRSRSAPPLMPARSKNDLLQLSNVTGFVSLGEFGFTTTPMFSTVEEKKRGMQVAAVKEDAGSEMWRSIHWCSCRKSGESELRTVAVDRMMQYGGLGASSWMSSSNPSTSELCYQPEQLNLSLEPRSNSLNNPKESKVTSCMT